MYTILIAHTMKSTTTLPKKIELCILFEHYSWSKIEMDKKCEIDGQPRATLDLVYLFGPLVPIWHY